MLYTIHYSRSTVAIRIKYVHSDCYCQLLLALSLFRFHEFAFLYFTTVIMVLKAVCFQIVRPCMRSSNKFVNTVFYKLLGHIYNFGALGDTD